MKRLFILMAVAMLTAVTVGCHAGRRSWRLPGMPCCGSPTPPPVMYGEAPLTPPPTMIVPQ